MSDSLVRVSRRVGPLRRPARSWPECSSRRSGARRVDPRSWARPATAASGDGWRACWRGRNRSCLRRGARGPRGKRQSGTLASNDFTYYFTFFPKFFSSFPHGTCSLSGSRKYLALEGHHLPLSAAVPSSTTHRKGLGWGRSDRTGLLPSPARCHNNELYLNPVRRPNPDYNSTTRGPQIFILSCSRFTRRY